MLPSFAGWLGGNASVPRREGRRFFPGEQRKFLDSFLTLKSSGLCFRCIVL
jgi:hypothetical protein